MYALSHTYWQKLKLIGKRIHSRSTNAHYLIKLELNIRMHLQIATFTCTCIHRYTVLMNRTVATRRRYIAISIYLYEPNCWGTSWYRMWAIQGRHSLAGESERSRQELARTAALRNLLITHTNIHYTYSLPSSFIGTIYVYTYMHVRTRVNLNACLRIARFGCSEGSSAGRHPRRHWMAEKPRPTVIKMIIQLCQTLSVCMHICVCMCMCVYVCAWVCMCMYTCMCVFICG